MPVPDPDLDGPRQQAEVDGARARRRRQVIARSRRQARLAERSTLHVRLTITRSL